MATTKKTLYDILAVPADALDTDIQAAYTAASAKLQAQKNRISADDFDFKTQVLHLAFTTLSSPSSRDAYDAKLAALAAPTLALVPLHADAETLSLRAEAMALRADAMTLRADAMALRSGAAPFHESRSFASTSASATPRLVPMVRKILMVLGTLFAIGAVSQSVSMLLANRRAEMAATAAAQASEKVLLQEYYQTHGIRPANKAQMDALEAEERRKDNDKLTAEREKTKREQDARRFEEESHRRGAQIAADLSAAELQAKEQARREDERKEWQQKEEQRSREQIERNRIERQKSEWREVLRR